MGLRQSPVWVHNVGIGSAFEFAPARRPSVTYRPRPSAQAPRKELRDHGRGKRVTVAVDVRRTSLDLDRGCGVARLAGLRTTQASRGVEAIWYLLVRRQQLGHHVGQVHGPQPGRELNCSCAQACSTDPEPARVAKGAVCTLMGDRAGLSPSTMSL